MSLSFVFEVVALVCLILAAINVPVSKLSMGWLGMAFWLGALMMSGVVLR